MPTKELIDSLRIVDTDSHIIEEPDLWTSRLPKRLAEIGPRVERQGDLDNWVIGASSRPLHHITWFAAAGWKEFPPSTPETFDECDQAGFKAEDRLVRLDEYGIYAQVLYPNIVGFHGKAFLDELGPEDATVCVQAYNDYLTDFCSADPKRLIAIAALPWWDIDACVAEIQRVRSMGHRGLLFSVDFEKIGLPPIQDAHWAPVLGAAQEAELSMNLHIGFGQETQADRGVRDLNKMGTMIARTQDSAGSFLSVGRHVAKLATNGVCIDFPDLKWVVVESGTGWVPFVMETLDWHWVNFGAHKEAPERELPSFYIKRNVYGTFWFEKHIEKAFELLPDNMMFETDFPHPTSLSPGPASAALLPNEQLLASLQNVSDELAIKAAQDNAFKLYHLT
ncbi:MAG: amidohydrolase family protein [Ilumatobacteraceae bacterium]